MTGPYSWSATTGRGELSSASGNIAVRKKHHGYDQRRPAPTPMSLSVDPSELEAVRYVARELGDTHFIVGAFADRRHFSLARGPPA
jgi:hypothetical protein